MIDFEMVEPFYKWLDNGQPGADEIDMHELGLVADAPMEALKAYKEFQKIMREAEGDGVEA